MTNILYVIDYITCNSGVCSIAMNYYTKLDTSNFLVDFLCFEEPEEEFKSLFKSRNSKYYVVGKPILRNFRGFMSRIERFMTDKGNKYDIIHVHVPVVAFICLKQAKRVGIEKRIIHSHSTKGSESFVKAIRNDILNRLGVLYATDYYACSRAAAEYLFGKKGKKNVLIIPNAIDFFRFKYSETLREQYRARYGIKGKKVVGYVARFSPIKNHEFLVKLAEEMDEADVYYLCVGDGPTKERIQDRVREKGLDNRFIFMEPSSDLRGIYAAMDVFVFPSLAEGFGMVALEAQISGLEIIASNKVSNEARITDRMEFLSLDNVEMWISRIKNSLNNKKDREFDNISFVREQYYNIEYCVRVLEESYLNEV